MYLRIRQRLELFTDVSICGVDGVALWLLEVMFQSPSSHKQSRFRRHAYFMLKDFGKLVPDAAIATSYHSCGHIDRSDDKSPNMTRGDDEY